MEEGQQGAPRLLLLPWQAGRPHSVSHALGSLAKGGELFLTAAFGYLTTYCLLQSLYPVECLPWHQLGLSVLLWRPGFNSASFLELLELASL